MRRSKIAPTRTLIKSIQVHVEHKRTSQWREA